MVRRKASNNNGLVPMVENIRIIGVVVSRLVKELQCLLEGGHLLVIFHQDASHLDVGVDIAGLQLERALEIGLRLIHDAHEELERAHHVQCLRHERQGPLLDGLLAEVACILPLLGAVCLDGLDEELVTLIHGRGLEFFLRKVFWGDEEIARAPIQTYHNDTSLDKRR